MEITHPHNHPTQNKNLRAVFILAICFVFALAIFSYVRINALIESGQLVTHTTRVTLELEKVIGSLKDAETGHGGYLLTHDPRFLEPFNNALNEYPDKIKPLRQLTIDNPTQQQNLVELERLAQRRQNYMLKMLEVDKSRPPTAAELLIGKSIMDSLRTEVNTMIAHENDLMQHHSEELRKQTMIAPAILLILCLLALVILILAYRQLDKSLVKAQQLKAETIKQAVQLEKAKEIHESEQRFQAAVKAVHGILWTNNAKGEMEGEQPGWASLTGQSYEEYKGYGWAKAVHPDDAQPTVDAWQEAVEQRKTFIFEHRVKTKDEGWRDFSIRAIPLVNPDGSLRQWVGVHTDITERKRAEKTLKENETRLNLIIEASELGTWELNLKTHEVTYSKKYLEIFGYKEYQLIAHSKLIKHLHPDDLGIRTKAFDEAMQTGILKYEARLIWADKSIHWMQGKGKVFWDKENQPFRVMGTIRDITAEKNYQERLEESERKFRLLADSMPQHIWTADTEGNLNYFNQSVFDFSGLTLEQINKDGWLQIVHPDDREKNIQQWFNSISTGQDFLLEHRFRRYDGQYRWQLSRAIPQKDENGKIQMWVGTSTDIQEQIELSETLGENLKRSNQRMQTILQQAPDAVISIDEDGIIRSWNAESETIFGWKEDEAIGKVLSETIIPKRYREGHDIGMKHFLRTGEGPVINKPIELSALKKNGSEFPVELKISTSKIDDRFIFIGFIRDISIRRQAEETIQNKTNQLMEAQQLAHIGSWEWDVQTNKINWSDELFRIFGLTPQEFNADYETYLTYIHSDDREYVNSIVQQALKDHQPYNFFHKAVCADGKVRILSATGKVITDAAGDVIRMSGTAQDVTEQKKYEEELKISEERFYKIFDSNPVPMTLSEIQTNKIKYANNLFYNAFGYNKEEVIGHSSEELNLIDPQEYKRVIDLIFGYLHENRSLAEVQALSKEEMEALLLKLKQSENMKHFEILYTRKNGEKFPALVSFEVIMMGSESYTVTSYQDITERKKAEEQLRSQNDQLEKMNKELESFAYISSHDLQEPLRKIQTFATRLVEKEYNNLTENGKDQFSRMQKAAERMQTLINDLLAYSRTSTSDRKYEYTDLNKMVEEVKEDLKEELQQKHATVEATELGEINIIPFQFRQLLHNLISNSLKFSNADPAPYIKIKSEFCKGSEFKNDKLLEDTKYCHISISDNGIGFEQHFSEKIFELFQRLHGKTEYNGTGIGLAIVKKIVENHNGIITANSQLNKGATFDIYLPTT